MKYLVLLVALFATLQTTAQTATIPVAIKLISAADSTEEVSAVVAIKDAAGRQVFAENVNATDTFRAQPNTTYTIHVVSLQRKPIESTFKVRETLVHLDVTLQPEGTQLESVVIVAKKPFIRMEDDKEIIDAGPIADGSTSAYEVLEKTPGAVAIDGNIYLNSSTPAVVQINGRQLKLKGEDVSALLKSLPANGVEKVEILRTPSAKYDASSSGGILNIVLKKGVKLGSSGSVNASTFQGKRNTSSTGISLNRTAGDNTTYLGYQFSNRNNYRNLNTTRQANSAAVIEQVSTTGFNAQNHNLRGGIDHAFSPNLNLAYDGLVSYTRNQTTSANTNSIMATGSGAELATFRTDVVNPSNNLYLSNVVSSKWKLDSLGSTWENVAEYKLYTDNGQQDYTTTLTGGTAGLAGRGEFKNYNHLGTLQTDFTKIFPKTFKIEAGARYDISIGTTRADYSIDSGMGRGLEPNYFQTSHFNFNQQTTAGYLQFSKTFAGFNIKPGLRVEHTYIAGEQIFPAGPQFTIKRTDFFPYLYIRHNIFTIFKTPVVGTLTYRRSIERPAFDMLNPTPKYIDQFLYDIGNPGLRPQITTKYEASATFWDFPVFALGIRDNQNIFTNVSYQDPTTGIAYRTYDNLGRNRELFFRIVGGIPPTIGKYFFFVSAEYTERHFTGQYQESPIDYRRASWTLFSFHSYKPTKTLSINAYGFWLFRGFDRFYELADFGAVNLSVNKTLLDGKFTFALTGNDLFRTNRNSIVLNQPGIYATGSRSEDTRRVGVTLRYNFGLAKPKEQNPFEMMKGGVNVN